MKDSANKIAELIANEGTDTRGDLLLEVSRVLEFGTQYFTANIIKHAAIEYGLSQPPEVSDE